MTALTLKTALGNAFTFLPLRMLFPLSIMPFPTSLPNKLELKLASKALDQDLL